MIATASENRARAMYFGPKERALFGWFHPAAGASRGRGVVICPPLGYEGICAYPVLRTLAERLSAAGTPVLRFDYDGTGDSAGDDRDSGRVRAWIDSVGAAADELRAQSGVGEVVLFGVRMGATLALLSAAERGDVSRLLLWCPASTGKAFMREMKAFRMLAEQTGEIASRPRAEGDTTEESGGFLFSGETVDAIKKLDGLKLQKRAAERVLVIGRDDVPDDDKLARALESQGASASYQKLPGYAQMMVAPHKSQFPEEVYRALVAFLDGDAAAGKSRAAPTASAQGMVAPSVREEPIRFGAYGELFGVLTEPVNAGQKKPLIIFSNTAGNHRIGPNRMYVELARKWAGLGFSSLRIDVSGVGDSLIRDNPDDNHAYSDQLIKDARAAIAHFQSRGRADRFILAGLCSGAFVGYHTTLAEPSVVGVVLINPQTFKWEAGMSLDVSPLKKRAEAVYYQRRLLSWEAWKKMLAGGVDVRRAIGVVRGRAGDVVRARWAQLKAALPGAASRGTEVARAFDSMCERGTDVLIVFCSDDPGIANLNEKVGASLRALKKRPNFAIEMIEGPDHSFTPLWSQERLDEVLTTHLKSRF